MTVSSLQTSISARVSGQERAEILAIDAAATASDGVPPLDDQVRLDLEYGDPTTTRHLIVRLLGEPTVSAYGHLDLSSDEVASGHLVVAPDRRRQGLGTTLVRAMQLEAGPRTLRLWAHGDENAARFLSGRMGFRRVRDLWRMARALTDPLPEPEYPHDVTVRTFAPGQDDHAWVAANAAAFRDHPEQGAATVEDLRQRMAQPWFDPAGFFLAERAGRLLGFHWTKVHAAGPSGPAVGEVYVVGVHPDAQGIGLGRSLTLTGLRHLQSLGLPEVMLYVDADNHAAVAVYGRLGFRRTAIDVMYEA